MLCTVLCITSYVTPVQAHDYSEPTDDAQVPLSFDKESMFTVTLPEAILGSIGKGVTRIGAKAFYNCKSVYSVEFENLTGWKAGDTTFTSQNLVYTSKAADFLTGYNVNDEWTRS